MLVHNFVNLSPEVCMLLYIHIWNWLLTHVVLWYISIAGIKLKKINSPFCKRICINLPVVLRSRVPSTGLGPHVLIQTKLQTTIMHLNCNEKHVLLCLFTCDHVSLFIFNHVLLFIFNHVLLFMFNHVLLFTFELVAVVTIN